MTVKGLGNTIPTPQERERMMAVLEALRERLNTNAEPFAPPRYNEQDNTAELCWGEDGKPWGRPWISAWIDGLFASRRLYVWRHPSYRRSQDDEIIARFR